MAAVIGIIILIVIIYLISIPFYYTQYRKVNKATPHYVDFSDLFIMFLPGWNTLAALEMSNLNKLARKIFRA